MTSLSRSVCFVPVVSSTCRSPVGVWYKSYPYGDPGEKSYGYAARYAGKDMCICCVCGCRVYEDASNWESGCLDGKAVRICICWLCNSCCTVSDLERSSEFGNVSCAKLEVAETSS